MYLDSYSFHVSALELRFFFFFFFYPDDAKMRGGLSTASYHTPFPSPPSLDLQTATIYKPQPVYTLALQAQADT